MSVLLLDRAPPVRPGVATRKIPLVRAQLQVAWSNLTSGYFTVGLSTLGGPDVLAPSIFSQAFTGPNDDISDYLDSLAIQGGRGDLLGPMQGRTMTTTLSDPTGVFNSANPNSPIAAFLDVPYRQARLRWLEAPAPVAVTLAGGEITDLVRRLGWEGDGRAVESSMGIWPAATNLLPWSGLDLFTSFRDAILANNPIWWLRLGEPSGAVAADSSAGGHNGTYVGGVTLAQPSLVPGDPNTAVLFDGATGYVDANADIGSFTPSTPFSLAAWVKPAAITGNHVILANYDGTGRGWQMRLLANGKVRFLLNDPSAGNPFADSSLALVAGSRYRIVCTYNGNPAVGPKVMKIYVNGVDVSTAIQSDAAIANITSTANVRVGVDPGGSGYWFNGTIDEPSIYAVELPAGSVQSDYNRFQAAGWTLSDPDASVVDSLGASPKFGSGCMRLVNSIAGADDYESLLVAGLAASTAYTISAWVNVSAFTAGATTNRGLFAYDLDDAGTAQTATITGVTAGWVRLSVTVTTTATGGTHAIQVRLYAPQATVDWDGAQLELGAVLTPYVATYGLAKSRGAAGPSIPGSYLDATRGWLAARLRVGAAPQSAWLAAKATGPYLYDDFSAGFGAWLQDTGGGTIGTVSDGSGGTAAVLTAVPGGGGSELVALYLGASNAHSAYRHQGEETWYRAGIRFPSASYVPTPGEWNYVMEWHTDDATQAFGGNSTVIGVVSDDPGGTNPRLYFRLNGGRSEAMTQTYTILPSNSLILDHWYDMVVHIVWSTDPAVGRIEWWVDGVLKASYYATTLYKNPDGSVSYNTFGLYNYRVHAAVSSAVQFRRPAVGPTLGSVVGADEREIFAVNVGAADHIQGYFDGFDSYVLRLGDSTGETSVAVKAAPAAGDLVTVLFAWDASNLAVSVNGGAWNVTRNTRAPSVGAAPVQIGTAGSSTRIWGGEVFWVEAGKGAAAFTPGSFPTVGDPDLGAIVADAAPSFVWPADDATAYTPGQTVGAFYGFTKRITFEPQGRRGTAQIEFVDLFDRLEGTNPIIASTGPTTTGAAIGLLLDYIGWSDPAFRSLSTGETLADFQADGSQSALQIIADLLLADLGVFFQDHSGIVTYLDRVALATKDVRFTIGDGMRGIAPGVDTDRVRNRTTVTRSDFAGNTIGIPQQASDADSVHAIGIRDDAEVQSPYLRDDVQAQSVAAARLARLIRTRSPVWGLKLSGRTTKLLAQIIGGDLTDRVAAAESKTGSVGDYTIQSVSVTWDLRKTVEADWGLDEKVPLGTLFTVGVSVLGGPDVLL